MQDRLDHHGPGDGEDEDTERQRWARPDLRAVRGSLIGLQKKSANLTNKNWHEDKVSELSVASLVFFLVSYSKFRNI